MLDLSRVSGFDRDDGDSFKSGEKHSVSQAEAGQVFADADLLLAEDVKRSQDGPHYQALGQTTNGRLLHITFTLRYDQTKIRAE